MTSPTADPQAQVVLGQKYAYATAALLLGIASFVHLLGLEKALLAILFARLALKGDPQPALDARRSWARAGLALGTVMLITVPVTVVVFWDRIKTLVQALENLQ